MKLRILGCGTSSGVPRIALSRAAAWSRYKANPERMQQVLATLYICISDLAVAILPVIPASAARLLDQMGVPEDERSFAALRDPERYRRLAASGFKLEPPKPIFPRLELPADE